MQPTKCATDAKARLAPMTQMCKTDDVEAHDKVEDSASSPQELPGEICVHVTSVCSVRVRGSEGGKGEVKWQGERSEKQFKAV